jgi:hypothetical protein
MAKKTRVLANLSQARRDLIYVLLQLPSPLRVRPRTPSRRGSAHQESHHILGVPSNVSDRNLHRRLIARMRVRLYRSEVRPSRVESTTPQQPSTPGSSKFASTIVTFPAPTSPYGQKDTSACELVASAAGSNIYTLISRQQGYIIFNKY